jgi:tetratricopeptide (TPR) repeat protein
MHINIKKFGLVFLMLFFCILNNQAQNGTKQDSLLVEQYLQKAKEKFKTDIDTSIKYVNQILDFSQKRNYKFGLIKAYNMLGTIYSQTSDFNNAISNYQKAIDLAKEDIYAKELSSCLYNLSTTYFDKGDYNKSFDACTASLKIKIANKDSAGITRCYREMAEIYTYKEDYKKALFYAENALGIQRKLNSNVGLARCLSTAAGVYIGLKQYTDAIKYLKQAESLIDDENEGSIAEGIYNNIGRCYNEMGNVDEAERYYLKALEQCEYYENTYSETIILNNLGQIYLTKGKNDLAEKYLLKALPMAEQTGSFLDLADIHSNLADVYFSEKNFKQAYKHKEAFIAFSDSVMNKEKMKTIEELTIKFETKEIAFKNAALKKKVTEQKYTIVRNLFWLYGALSIALLAILLSIFYTRQNNFKTRLERMELEQQQYRAQMNPHFIFNCLNSIQHYIVHNDVISANKYLSEFASLMRKTLENNQLHAIELQHEIEYLKSYLTLEQMRFENKFTYEINCAPNVNVFDTQILPMIIQPFAENAIVHGLCYLEKDGKLSIHFEKQHDYLICKIDDNGIGRAASQEIKKQSSKSHVSQGVEMIQKRLELVSKITNRKFEVEIIDKKDDKGSATGTLVILKFPTEI